MTICNSKGERLEFSYTKDNIHIFKSYLIDRENMDEWLDLIRRSIRSASGLVYKRSNDSWRSEWIAHNVLYNMGIQRSRTSEVDLNEDETKFRRFCYSVIAFL